MERPARPTSNQILGESSPNVPRRVVRGPSASTAANLKAKDSKPLIPQLAPASQSAQKLDPAPNKLYVLTKIRNNFARKYPGFSVQKYLTPNVPDDEQLNKSMPPLTPFQEQEIIDQMRQARRSKSQLKQREKYANVLSKVDSNLSQPSKTFNMTSQYQSNQQIRPRLSRINTPLRNHYQSETTFKTNQNNSTSSKRVRNKEASSFSSMDQTITAQTAHSFQDSFRPKTVHEKSVPQSGLLSTYNSKDALKEDTRIEQKKIVEALSTSNKFTKFIVSMDENSAFKSDESGQRVDDNTKYKYFYQKYKDPRNRKIVPRKGQGNLDTETTTYSMMSGNNSILNTIEEGRETTMASQRRARFYDSSENVDRSHHIMSSGFSEINIQDGGDMSFSVLGNRRVKKQKGATLSVIQKNLMEMNKITKNSKKLFEDSSKVQLEMLSMQMKKDYRALRKNVKEQKSGQYNFQGFLKTILGNPNEHIRARANVGNTTLNNENINRINLLNRFQSS